MIRAVRRRFPLLAVLLTPVLALAAPPPSPSPPPPAELLYFVLVDRFADGLPDEPSAVDRTDPQAWHGGDLVGVQERLDHLAAMGVTRLWLSPVFHSRQASFHGHGAFHGYWVEDLDRIEDRFGGRRALRRLARASQKAGIGLVLDMVYNHVSFDSGLRTQHPDWFHDAGSITDWNDPVQLVQGQVHGLPDLAQERAPVYRYLHQRSRRWARVAHAQGFRVDAVRHLPLDFLHRLSADLQGALGEDFWLLGEDFQGDPVALAQSFQEGGFDAMFDFPLRYAMVDVFCHGRSPGWLGSVLSLDRLYADPGGLVTFLDNHDLPRIAAECGGDRGRVEAALLFQFAQRGVPALTYGTEWMLPGSGEPENRADVPWHEPPVLADTIGQLQALRRAHPLLRDPRPRQHTLVGEGVLVSRADSDSEGMTLIVNHGARTIPAPRAATAWAMAGGSGGGAALQLSMDGAPPPVLPPGAVGLYLHPPEARAAAAGAVMVEVVASAPGGADWREDEVWAVGAGPELGHWDPARGVVLSPGAGGSWSAAVVLPAGTIAAWKVVRRTPEGVVVWEEGENRYLSVGGASAREGIP